MSAKGTLKRLSYISVASKHLSETDVSAIVMHATEQNAQMSITGILALYKGNFYQCIEGLPAAVDSLLGRIAQDQRHSKLTVMVSRHVESRLFEGWAMANANDVLGDLTIPALSDLFDGDLLQQGH